jgi:hypothetical protein
MRTHDALPSRGGQRDVCQFKGAGDHASKGEPNGIYRRGRCRCEVTAESRILIDFLQQVRALDSFER